MSLGLQLFLLFFFLSLSLEESRLVREEDSKTSIIEQLKLTGKGK